MRHRVSHADANGVESSVKKLATLFLAFAAWELALLNSVDQGTALRGALGELHLPGGCDGRPSSMNEQA